MLQIDHIHFYVENALAVCHWFINVMGFELIASGSNSHTHTEIVASNNEVKFLLSSPINNASPVAKFLRHHPPGVADVSFAVNNLHEAIAHTLSLGATLSQPIQQWHFPHGNLASATIVSQANIFHTLCERHGVTPTIPYLQEKPLINPNPLFRAIDHIVLNVGVGELDSTVKWYEKALGFQRQQTFSIQTERSALFSQVMIHPSCGVKFPVNEPRSTNSQIQEFLDINNGSGIQHIALQTHNISQVTAQLRTAGLNFLNIPSTYYDQLQYYYQSLGISHQEWQQLVEQQILIDYPENEDSLKPLLLQIFTKPIFPQPTFFFELIERRDQAQGFGEGNFRALFEAVEKEQLKRKGL